MPLGSPRAPLPPGAPLQGVNGTACPPKTGRAISASPSTDGLPGDAAATVDAIADTLTEDGLVLRYRTDGPHHGRCPP